MPGSRATSDRKGQITAGKPLLDVRGLGISFKTEAGELQATRNVTFSLNPGERVGVVGESGCGKTITGLSLLGLLPAHSTRVEGVIEYDGRNLVGMAPRELRKIRGPQIGMIFQEPMSALDPVFTIGQQITETIRAHRPVSRKEAREQAIAGLADVGIPLPAQRFDEYPHQLSGGMRQRAMIAVALSCKPRLLIADEPTTALDVTIQAQIMDLLVDLSERNGTALLLITHDLGVVAEVCSRMVTMYAGEIVEDAPVDDVLVRPNHPYTSGLLRSLPRLTQRGAPLSSIPGRVPALTQMPSGCRFKARCSFAEAVCAETQILQQVAPGRLTRCRRHGELDLPGALL